MSPRRRRSRAVASFALVSAVLVGAVGCSSGPAAGPTDPASIAPPPGVTVPVVPSPRPVATAVTLRPGARLDPAAVRRAVAPSLADRHLGKHVRAVVAPLGGGAPVLQLGSGTATPASTTKLVTTTSALLALGPDAVFTTKVVATVRGRSASLVLVGGGDPYLERRADDPDLAGVPVGADVTTLAKQTAAALRGRGVRRVTVGYDDSLFSGPAVNPEWEPDYVPSGEVAPTSALWVDEGRTVSRYGRVADPALEATSTFATALAKDGVAVTGDPTQTHARGATIASMRSAPLGRIVEHILMVSDNDGAEVLLRQVGLAREGSGSFAAGRRAVAALMGENGIDLAGSVLYDGSGLSRHDRLDPTVLMDVLRLAASAKHPELRSVVSGLPVAGFSGSLTDRMDKGPPAGLGRVRAKTGTLSNVSSLAGIALDLDGDPLVFVLMADRIAGPDELAARVAQDDAAADLGACHCGR